MRRLQPFTVNLYRREFERARAANAIEELAGGAVFAARALFRFDVSIIALPK